MPAKPAAKKPAPKRHAARTPKPASRKPAPRREQSRRPAATVLPAEVVQHFGTERIDLVRSQLPPDSTDADLARLLLEAIRLSTDPVRGGIYLAREHARDAGPATYAVVAKRDVLLAYAERQPSFKDHDGDSIYSADNFELVPRNAESPNLLERAGIMHLAGHPKERGDLIGAYGVVEVAGRSPLRFIALCAEYLPDLASLDQDDPRRRFPDRYMVKAAQCWPLRMAFGLNDVVGAEEMPDFASRKPAPAAPAPPAAEDPLDALDHEALEMFADCQRFLPGRFTVAELRARLLGGAGEAAVEEMRAALVERHESRLAELDGIDPEQDLDEAERLSYTVEREDLEQRLGALEGRVTATA